jgi:hypothetical protein
VNIANHEDYAGTLEFVPLTWSQEGIWYQSAHEPESFQVKFNIFIDVRNIDVSLAALRATINRLIARNETLRTTLGRIDGRVVQCIHPPSPADIIIHSTQAYSDLNSIDAGAIFSDLRDRPFDLYNEKLARFGAVVDSKKRARLFVIVIHHIAMDYWGARLLMEEILTDLRGTQLETSYAPREVHRRQPRDVALSESTAAMKARNERSLRYWSGWFQDAPVRMLSNQGKAEADPHLQTGRIQSYAMDNAAQQIAENFGVTKPSVYLALYSSFVSILAGLPFVAFRMEVAGRDRAARQAIGCFFHHTFLSVDLSGASSFDEILQRTYSSSLIAQNNANCSFFDIKRVEAEVAARRGVFFSFDVSFNYLTYPGHNSPKNPCNSVASEIEWLPSVQEMYLDLACEINPERGIIDITSDMALVSQEQISRMLRGFVSVLMYIAENNTSITVSEIAASVGINGPAMNHSWVVSEGCWVNLKDVSSLIEGHPSVVRCRARVGRKNLNNSTVITAEIIASSSDLTPHSVHLFVSALLSSKRTIIAPHWYEIFIAGEDGNRDLDYENALMVSSGTGRAALLQRRLSPVLSRYLAVGKRSRVGSVDTG